MKQPSALLLACSLLAVPCAAQEKFIPMVSYEVLAREVQKHRGKVVLVDFWSDH